METIGTMTALCYRGDLTIGWDEENKEEMLNFIKRKMKEGYVFFTTKKYLFGTVEKTVEVTDKDIANKRLSYVIVPDDQIEAIVGDLDDEDMKDIITTKKAKPMKPIKKSLADDMVKTTDPEEVLRNDSIAIRPIHGG